MKDAFRQGIAHVGDKIDLNLWRQKVFFLGYSREKAETQKQTKMFSWLRFKMKYRIASYFEWVHYNQSIVKSNIGVHVLPPAILLL